MQNITSHIPEGLRSIVLYTHTHTHTHTHTPFSGDFIKLPLLLLLNPFLLHPSCLCVCMCIHLQASFIDFVVYPLWELWAELVFPHAQFVLDRWHAMQEYWTDMIPTSPNRINSTDDSAELDRSNPPVAPLVEQNREAERCWLSGGCSGLAVVAVQLS